VHCFQCDLIVPGTPQSNDSNAVELGVKFRTSVNGAVRAIRFYKSPLNTGTHIGNLWDMNGANLATVIFTSETQTGWQEASFPQPVSVAAETTYIASYHTTVGYYSIDQGFFSTATVADSITFLANGSDGPNGVYCYSQTSAFPTDTFQQSNYWVDIVLEVGPDETSPYVLSKSPASGEINVVVDTTISVTFNEGLDESTVTQESLSLVKVGSGISVNGQVSYVAGTRMATFVPEAALAYTTTYRATLLKGVISCIWQN